jgi:HEPN domain-containing protein
MNRNDLQRLSRIRLKEARVLLEAKCYDGAYYLCGYAVELALKACIAKMTRRHDFPDKKTVNDSYSHNLASLVGVAGLTARLVQETNRDQAFGLNWTTLKDWSEERRYRLNSEKEARDLYRAVTARQHGVMRWIRQHW